MSAQPEALRLANELEACPTITYKTHAAELRRLHTQRDALLEALKDATKTIEHLGYPLAAIERARAAIAAAEGEEK